MIRAPSGARGILGFNRLTFPESGARQPREHGSART